MENLKLLLLCARASAHKDFFCLMTQFCLCRVMVGSLGHSYESWLGWTFNIQSHKLTALKIRFKHWIRPRRAVYGENQVKLH